MIKDAISKLIDKTDLTAEEARGAMNDIMSGSATPAQIGAFLVSLRMKGETVEEIVSFANAMLAHAVRLKPKVKGILVDTCGTGGDRIKTFNVSTAAAFAASGAGLAVAKHGNRSVTSNCGSADVLEALGVNISAEPATVEKCIENVGIGFMFAPVFHPAMKFAIAPRRELGVRTVFNVLGPLTNPAGAKAQVMGVYDASLTEKLANVLMGLGSSSAMVVHGLDGVDEISNIGETQISILKNSSVETICRSPEDFGIRRVKSEDIGGLNPEDSAIRMVRILKGEKSALRDLVLLNSAAAIIVGGMADDWGDAADIARNSIDSGAAYRKLTALITASGGELQKFKKLEGKA